jgi:hypothetical protein
VAVMVEAEALVNKAQVAALIRALITHLLQTMTTCRFNLALHSSR